MKEELQEQLDQIPVVAFSSHKEGTPFHDCGCECGDGWFGLLRETLEGLGGLSTAISILQVKEKFGELRIEIDIPRKLWRGSVVHKVSRLLSDAAAKSRTICELCGKPGEWKTRGDALTTRCSKCEKKSDTEEGS